MNRKQRRRLKKDRQAAASADAAGNGVDALLDEAARCHQQGRPTEALDLYRRVLKAEPDNFPAHANRGNVLAGVGRTADAAEAYGRALDLEPSSVPVLCNLAVLKSETGKREEALAIYRRILALAPDDAEARHGLTLIKKFEPGDPDIAAMEELRGRPGLAEEKRMFLDFALAKALNDTGDHDRAFEAMASANRVKRTTMDFDIAAEEALVERIIGVFGEPLLDGGRESGFGGETPIFIVGMPRSGTTLVEQILASHTDVTGGGELNHFRDVVTGRGEAGPGLQGISSDGRGFPEGATGLAPGDFRRLGETYLALLRGQAPEAPRITDKMPRNFFFAGLIRLALPGARIVHCTRNPVDTCLSCYQIHFPAGQEFTYDLTELGRYYRLYRRLMDHWRAVLGDRVFPIAYEDLVAAPETHMRALLDFAGLPWQDACLDFHKTERQIRTASAQQVRRPIYRTAVQRWKKYEKHLGPLLEALGPLAQDC